MTIRHLKDLVNTCTRYTVMYIQGGMLLYVIYSVVFRYPLQVISKFSILKFNIDLIFCFHTTYAVMLPLAITFCTATFTMATCNLFSQQVFIGKFSCESCDQCWYWCFRTFDKIFLAESEILHKPGKSGTAEMLKGHRWASNKVLRDCCLLHILYLIWCVAPDFDFRVH